MELRYSGAAGITADRVADKSFNNAKIRRAWMYNCGIFVDEPYFSLSLSLSPSSLSILQLFLPLSLSLFVEVALPAGYARATP